MVINEDVLNEMDMLMILLICSDACERKKMEQFEDIMVECILSGIDEEACGDSSL